MRVRSLVLAVGLVLPSALLIGLPGQAAPTPSEGEAVYKRCAACHLPSGAGVPGAYPPLRGDIRALAAKPEGRRYLALVVTKGVSGPIAVEGKTFRGVMPAQAGLTDAQVASVLNHVIASFSKGATVKPFSAAEITQAKASGAGMTSAAVGKLNAPAGQ
jgi:mono/diheme cytochrome c family protein